MPREKKNIKYLNIENRGITALDSVKFDYDVENDCYYKDIREFLHIKKPSRNLYLITFQYTYIERVGVKYYFDCIKTIKKGNKFGLYAVYSPKPNIIETDIEDILDYEVTKYDFIDNDDSNMHGINIWNINELKLKNILKNGEICCEGAYIIRDGVLIMLRTIYLEINIRKHNIGMSFGFWRG